MAESTQLYKWTGINHQGKRTDGEVQANDMKEALTEVKKLGVEVISLVPKQRYRISVKQKKIKIKDIQLFTRYLSTMLAAGLPIIQALNIIGQDQDNQSMKVLINSIKSDISSGKTLGETFGQYPKYFNGLYCNLVRAGEKSGTLDKILARLAVYLEKVEQLKRKVKKALTYPVVILGVAFIVSGILLLFVVPQFQQLFSSFGAKLPWFTRMVVNFSDFLRDYWWVILAVVSGSIVWIRYTLKHSLAAKTLFHRYILKVYIIGNVLKKSMIARFARTLATTLEAGMPIVESMRSMAPIMGNVIYVKAVQTMSDDISSGNTLSASMSATHLFPNMVIQMIAVGEASGKLADMLNKVADYYDEEVSSIVDNLSSLLEPVIMLVLGGIVGTFVVAMYLPIFKIGSLF